MKWGAKRARQGISTVAEVFRRGAAYVTTSSRARVRESFRFRPQGAARMRARHLPGHVLIHKSQWFSDPLACPLRLLRKRQIAYVSTGPIRAKCGHAFRHIARHVELTVSMRSPRVWRLCSYCVRCPFSPLEFSVLSGPCHCGSERRSLFHQGAFAHLAVRKHE